MRICARGTEFAVVSRAPYTRILPFQARMGWTVPRYSSYGNAFNRDYGLGSTAGLLDLTALGAVGGERVLYHDEYEV